MSARAIARKGPVFIEAAEVADMLGISYRLFLARREALEEAGFPPPITWSCRPLKWRADAVAAWIDGQGVAYARPPISPEDLESGRVALLRRAKA